MSRVQRRLAAVMFTDMVGYTALSQKNETEALKLLEEHRKIVRPFFPRHNGREIKTIGDAFLIEFDSALEAVRCAFEIQQSLHERNRGRSSESKVMLRVGVHLGDVIRSGTDIYGDAVNIASRIEPLTEPGGICITEQVYDQVRNKFEFPFSSLGRKELKNFNDTIEIFRAVLPWEEKSSSSGLDMRRIAVMPFANMSRDEGNEYFADGMTEELISSISKIVGLSVISRTSVMKFKGGGKTVAEIGQELKAGTLLEGSVRKADNMVRVSAQLIDVNTDENIWSESYDRDLKNIFAIQSEIAKSVADALRIKIFSPDIARIDRKPTENTTAYTLYLKDRYFWNERNKISVEKGIKYLEKAIEADPKFALAYSDLASAYGIMGDHGMISTEEAQAKIEEYAEKALDLDPSLSQPHASLAWTYWRNYQWDEAERELKLAIKLNPNNATAHQWHALQLDFSKRYGESLQEYRRARELDPLSLMIRTAQGYVLVRSGQKEEGLSILRDVTEQDESFANGHLFFAFAFLLAGMKNEAVEEAKKISTHEPAIRASIASVYAAAGFHDEATALLDRILKERETTFIDPFDIANVYAALGDETNALHWLQRAVGDRSVRVTRVISWPFFDKLSTNPKFQKIIAPLRLE